MVKSPATNAPRRPVLVTGGTGGHVFPAIAVAEQLVQRGQQPLIVSDARGASYLREVDFDTQIVPSGGWVGVGLARRIRSLLAMLRGFFIARRLLRRHRASLVVGFGGYSSVAPLLAARSLGLPTLLHEQNAVMGRANRFLSRRVDRLLLSFPATLGTEAVSSALVIGNPVRRSILASPALDARPDGSLNLLVLGGSQGARALADAVPEALNRLSAAQRKRVKLVMQVRQEDQEALRKALPELGQAPDLRSFFSPIADFLAAADLVIARAGATTCAELAVAGRAAIFVPLPSSDQHQKHNAQAMQAAGAAWVIPQDARLNAGLAERLEQLIEQPELRQNAARATQNLQAGQASLHFADLIEELQ